MKKRYVTLTENDRKLLESLLRKGVLPVKIYKRSTALLALDRGGTYIEVSRLVHVTPVTVAGWAKKYKKEGINCLYDKPRSGRPNELSQEQRNKIVSLSNGSPPVGQGQWSLRLLASEAVKRGICDHISHTEVATILKKAQKKQPS